MPDDLVIVGGGGHSSVVTEAARSCPNLWNVIGFLDPSPCHEISERLGLPHLGGDSEYTRWSPNAFFVLGVGGLQPSTIRQRIVEERLSGAKWGVVVHSSAWVSPTASLEDGCVVLAGATVNSGASIGRHCVVNTGAIIEHDVRLEPYVIVGPRAAVGGASVIESGCVLGLGCAVRDHIHIGQSTMIGMGAVVVSSVPDNTVATGNPARLVDRR